MTQTTTTRKLSPAERGSLGGKATAQRHGSMHMEAIGRAGFWATVEKHFGGDVQAYMQMLRAHRAKGQENQALGCRVYQSVYQSTAA